MTRLVVHIGAQRTASPGLHKSLFDNSAKLLEHGVLVPVAGRHDMSPRAVRHQLLPWSFDPHGDHPYDATVWEELTAEVAASSAHTVLLTSELFSAVVADADLAPLLLQRLQELSDDVSLVFLARDQLGLLNSLYCQRVRALELTCDFDTYLAEWPDAALYDLAESFGPWCQRSDVRFLARTWDPSSGEDALPAILELAGIDIDASELLESEGTDDQLGAVGVEANRLLGSYLRGRFPEFQSGEIAARRLRRKAALALQAHGWDNDDYWGWSPDQAARAVTRYAASNQLFAKHAWGGRWDLVAPLSRERRVADLVELDPISVNRVHRYLIEMEEAFGRLRRREVAA